MRVADNDTLAEDGTILKSFYDDFLANPGWVAHGDCYTRKVFHFIYSLTGPAGTYSRWPPVQIEIPEAGAAAYFIFLMLARLRPDADEWILGPAARTSLLTSF